MILEEAPEAPKSTLETQGFVPDLLLVSGRSSEALRDQAQLLQSFVEEGGFHDLRYTLAAAEPILAIARAFSVSARTPHRRC